MTEPWILRPIRPCDDGAVAAIIHAVMTEHRCSGDGFAIHDDEVRSMSAHYRGPGARYYVVTRGDDVHGGGGFAPLAGAGADEGLCELRKMYFLPAARGLGLGRELLRLLLDDMRQAGFSRCYLETTSWMQRAQQLYREAGFEELPGPLGATGHHGCDKYFARHL